MNDNAELIRSAYELLNGQKAEELAELYAEGSTFSDIPLGVLDQDHEGMKKLWTDTWASMSGFRMDPDFIIADERGGAADFTMTGKHTGDFPGYPATGKSFSLKGASVIKIADGKIVEWTDYWSTGDIDRQIGPDSQQQD